MDGSQLVAQALQPRYTSQQKAQMEGKRRRAQFTADITSVTPLVKLAKAISIALVAIAGISALDFVILWITSGRLIERIPF
jgi:hypothetical protein